MAPTVSIGGIHLVNSNGTPTAGGAATAASTTPFAIRKGWSLNAPEPQPVWGGGPPFAAGRRLAYSSYENVVERIPISVVGSDHENAVARLQELKQALSTISATTPAVFEVKPTASSTAMDTDVYSAFVREVTEQQDGFEAWEGFAEIDAEIMLTRAPFWAKLSTGETVINAQSIAVAFSGSPDDIVAYTAGSGDLIYEGQPLNIAMTNASGFTLGDFDYYLGTIDSMTTTSSTQTVTTSNTTTGALSAAGNTVTVGTVLDAKQATKMRVLAVCSSVSAGAQMRLEFYFSSSAPAPFYVGPWFAPNTNDDRYDAGTVPSSLFKDTNLTTMLVWLRVKSSSGSQTITIANIYTIYYYTMCRISGLDSILNTTGVLHVRQFTATTNRPCLPLRRAEVYILNSGSQTYYGRIDGTPPVYITGASLWLFATSPTLGPVNATFTATATQAPLWKTLRGSD